MTWHTVNFESRSIENSTKQDVQNAKRTLRYLKGTQKLGIQYFSSESNDVVELKAFCDSDYAGDVKNRKSTTGYVVMYAGGPISWYSRKQSIVALFTIKAEYTAAAERCKKIKHL